MKITQEMLKIIRFRGDILEEESKMDTILKRCLRSSINGFDFEAFKYDEDDQTEVGEMNDIKKDLEKLGFKVHFDGDEGNMHMFVSWD